MPAQAKLFNIYKYGTRRPHGQIIVLTDVYRGRSVAACHRFKALLRWPSLTENNRIIIVERLSVEKNTYPRGRVSVRINKIK